jgi:hypothetical protein
LGGQTPPVSALRSTMPMTSVLFCRGWTAAGNSEASKKAQNQATKNITSEAMNMIMPYRRWIWTTGVWSPAWASLMTSRHHMNMV